MKYNGMDYNDYLFEQALEQMESYEASYEFGKLRTNNQLNILIK